MPAMIRFWLTGNDRISPAGVFAVVAQTRDAARRATKLGKIEIEAEPPVGQRR